MIAADLLNDLRTSGFILRIKGDALHVAPADRLTDDLRAAIRANKPDLLALLALPSVGDRVYLLSASGATVNLEPWRVDAITTAADGCLLATFHGRPYHSWPLADCRKARGG